MDFNRLIWKLDLCLWKRMFKILKLVFEQLTHMRSEMQIVIELSVGDLAFSSHYYSII